MKILNSTVMPNPGDYKLTKITPEEFGKLVREAEYIESYIMFRSTAKVVKKLSGRDVKVRKKKCFFNGEEEEYVILALKDGFHSKIDIDSFNYYKCKYTP